MLRVLMRTAIAIAAAACAGAGPRAAIAPVGAYPPHDLGERSPKTRAEASGFTETSTYADVVAFIDSLRARSPDIHATSFGRTSQGKDLPLVILARPLVRTAAEARRSGRPVVFVQANIHGGEVEGKEALLALLRDLQLDKYKNVVDSLVIVALPIYNADGNDSLGPQQRNRSSQNGPALIGQRANGQGLDLNRDYIKAEAPETRAALDFFREWEPDVFVDLHTTNGSYHGYALTWAPPLNPAARFSGPYTQDTVLPALASVLSANHGVRTFPYGNFVGDSASRTWATYDHRPRFGTNYYGLRGRIAILSEAFSHEPFERRIASTYAFVAELLSLVAANAEEVMEVGREADRRTTAFASTPNSSPPIAIRSRLTQSPRMEDVLVQELVRTGDTIRHEAGLRPGFQRGAVRPVRMAIADRFDPALLQGLPYAWVFSAEQAPIVELLLRHNVFVERLTEPVTLRAERFRIDSVASGTLFQGHRELRLSGRWEADSVAFEAGAYVVRGGQAMGILALYLLEPQSDDGLATWNFLDAWLDGGRFPIARVLTRIGVPLSPVRRD